MKTYREVPELLIAGYNREKHITRDYGGRELFETSQNSADAARTAGIKGKLWIECLPQWVIIANTGVCFDQGGVNSKTA